MNPYDHDALVLLQEKRRANVALFEQSIKNERAAIQQDETIRASLEGRLQQEGLSDGERAWILSDLPKLLSTRENRERTIALLKTAILTEYDSMDSEEKMIRDARKI